MDWDEEDSEEERELAAEAEAKAKAAVRQPARQPPPPKANDARNTAPASAPPASVAAPPRSRPPPQAISTPPAEALSIEQRLRRIETSGQRPPYAVFLGSLPYDATEQSIRTFFHSHGIRIAAVRIQRFPDTQKIKTCFADVESLDALARAVALNGALLDNRPIRVDIADQRPSQSGPPHPPATLPSAFRSRFADAGPPPASPRDHPRSFQDRDRGAQGHTRGRAGGPGSFDEPPPMSPTAAAAFGVRRTGSAGPGPPPPQQGSVWASSNGGAPGGPAGAGPAGGPPHSPKPPGERPRLNLKPRTKPLPERQPVSAQPNGDQPQQTVARTPADAPPQAARPGEQQQDTAASAEADSWSFARAGPDDDRTRSGHDRSSRGPAPLRNEPNGSRISRRGGSAATREKSGDGAQPNSGVPEPAQLKTANAFAALTLDEESA